MSTAGSTAASPPGAWEPDRGAVAEFRDVDKSFGTTHAVKHLSLELRSGEVLALLGENGAGKSTCVKMIGGLYRPDSGSIVLDGEPVTLTSPADAYAAGIAVVHQSPAVFPDLSITENIFAGHLLVTPISTLNQAAMNEIARHWLEVLGFDIHPSTLAGDLRTGEQQLIEIARALAMNARVLILDEPTAALSSHEVDRLFTVIDELRRHGVTMMFVGHRLEEVFAIADRIAVLRDGALVGVAPADELSRSSVISMMVGRDLADLYPREQSTVGEVVLSVSSLGRGTEFHGVSFEVRAGEILGLGGLVGAGRTEVARTLFGITQPDTGRIELDGAQVHIPTSRAALDLGIAYVSEDRRGQSLVTDFSILDNATLPVLSRTTRFGLTSRLRELLAVRDPLNQMRLRFASYQQPVGTLSGGNQQKVVLAKWLATKPRVLILDEPTQGIDVQAKAEVHRIVSGLAAEGMAIILISSDMPELIAMSDRVVVMREGRQTATLNRSEVSAEAIGVASMGTEDEVKMEAPSAVAILEPRVGSSPRWSLSSTVKRLVSLRELGLVGVIVLIAVPVSILNPRFLESGNLTSILVDAALLLIIGAGQMLVILTGNIDVSVASTVGLSAYVAAMTARDHADWAPVAFVLAAILVGIACGVFNGLVIAYGRVPAIVATLGTLAIYRGLTSVIAGGRQVTFSDVPQAWLDFSAIPVGPAPLVVVISATVLIALAAMVHLTRPGREYFQVGSSPDGATLIGLDARRRVLIAYVICGGLAGLAGAMWASHFATVDSRVATGVELTVIASVIVGGVAISGGVGSVVGITLGTILLLLIRNGLSLVRVNPLWLQAAYGLVIIVAVVVNLVITRRSHHRKRA